MAVTQRPQQRDFYSGPHRGDDQWCDEESRPPASRRLNDCQSDIEARHMQRTVRHVEDAKNAKDERQAERQQQHV